MKKKTSRQGKTSKLPGYNIVGVSGRDDFGGRAHVNNLLVDVLASRFRFKTLATASSKSS